MLQRHRILRQSESVRALVRENYIVPTDFITPIFAVEGIGIKEEISSMPNYYRLSLDNLKLEVIDLWLMGLRCVLLFVKVPDRLKDNEGSEALNPDGLMQRAIKTIKDTVPEMVVMTDVALDPYSIYGHDGIVSQNKIVNDPTVTILAKMALSHAIAGADIVAPSDMMDGRILNIRNILEENNYTNTGIMSYSAKYASSFYGPFRDALDSAPGFGDKKTYQMDFHNSQEAVKETLADIEQGADIVMVKPGMPYLDIVKQISDLVTNPVAVYQVSGEYAMIKAASEKGWLNHDETIMESLVAFKRAGASLIASYFAKDIIRILEKK